MVDMAFAVRPGALERSAALAGVLADQDGAGLEILGGQVGVGPAARGSDRVGVGEFQPPLPTTA